MKLKGLYFHSFYKNTSSQGVVRKELDSGYYLCGYFSRSKRVPVQRVVHISEMTSWAFYETKHHMVEGFKTELTFRSHMRKAGIPVREE